MMGDVIWIETSQSAAVRPTDMSVRGGYILSEVTASNVRPIS